MTYKEFITKSSRADAADNDRVHFFSRKFAPLFAYLLFRCNFSPNVVTFLFLIAGLISVLALEMCFPVAAYIFWRIHLILDMADGAIARATQVFSNSAVGFDRSNHIIINTALFIVINKYNEYYLATCFILIAFYLYYLFDRNYCGTTRGSTRKFSNLLIFIKNAFGLEGYLLVSMILLYIEMQHLQVFVTVFYSMTFLSYYFLKLKKFIRSTGE